MSKRTIGEESLGVIVIRLDFIDGFPYGDY